MKGWPAIRRGGDTLIAAPTGSGKTLTAFLVCIDELLRDAVAGKLKDETRVLYVSPLKALASDIQRNLERPLAEIREAAESEGLTLPELRAVVRTGDTPAHVRQKMTRKPPHIVVTTPESLFLLLTSEKGRGILKTIDTVIVDEIHALARDKRGSHLMLSLERLTALTGKRPRRIGLSATQKPIEEIAAFLSGMRKGTPDCSHSHAAHENENSRVSLFSCTVIDTGHQRQLDLGIEVPASELSAVCSNEQWEEVYLRIKDLIQEHRSTVIFVNTRKMAERVAFHLAQHLGEDQVRSHHGSLSKARRLVAEEELRQGRLKAIVATASLELGIDIGYIDLVLQVGSPRAIATFLQRIGRSGHAVGALPKGRLIALTRDELVESLALIRAVRRGRLDRIVIPEQPLDILAQQVVAAVACEEWEPDALFQVLRGAYPYRNLTRVQFDEIIMMLADGYVSGARGRDRKSAFIHYDATLGKLRARRPARLAALTSGGAIPELGDFRVVTDDGTFVGTLNEDFAIESSAGDVFLLGNTSWMIAAIRGGEVVVRDANGAPPTIPFWLGEAPGRTVELSAEVAELRSELADRIEIEGHESDPLFSMDALADIRKLDPEIYRPATEWLTDNVGPNEWANLQAVHYLAVQKAALGVVPTQKTVVFERFFDDTGGMQLVIHAPFGMRINRGFGLALRKSFCRSFDFELQASADNDGVVLSLGPQQSFPLESMFKMLNARTVKAILEQAILAVPLFQLRWRWNTTRALAVLRSQAGKRVPPALQRFRSDDLMTAVFPAQTQCKEHLTGDIEIPDHPLVRQTMHDCLTEAIDIDGLIDYLEKIASGEIQLVARDTREPSPFAYQLLNAHPYAFLDGAPLEERRTRAVSTRRGLAINDLKDLTALDDGAAAQVAGEAWPVVRDADELYDVLLSLGVLPEAEAEPGWRVPMAALVAARRAATAVTPDGTRLWMAVESLDLVDAAYPGIAYEPARPTLPATLRRMETPEDARLVLVRSYLEVKGITTAAAIAKAIGMGQNHVDAILPAIEANGSAVRGHFLKDLGLTSHPERSEGSLLQGKRSFAALRMTERDAVQWCDRRLLMRVHRLTLDGLRKQIRPVLPEHYIKYLARHLHMTPPTRLSGPAGLADVVAKLEGFDAAAGAWESEILASRLANYQPAWLDDLCHSGIVTWARLRATKTPDKDGDVPTGTGLTRSAPLALMLRTDCDWLVMPENERDADQEAATATLRANAKTAYEALRHYGALFPHELKSRTGLLETQLTEALGELCRLGLVHADGFSAIRPLVSRGKRVEAKRRQGLAGRFAKERGEFGLGGRWSLFPPALQPVTREERAERWAVLLLQRYGVVFRDLLAREQAAPAWGELARVYRQMEMRGEIRGGRFVAGVFGEQYALQDAVEKLRLARDEGDIGEWVVVSAADPVNLIGVVTEAAKIPASRLTLMVIRDGKLVATREGGEITFLAEVSADDQQAMASALQLSGAFRFRSAKLTAVSAKSDDDFYAGFSS